MKRITKKAGPGYPADPLDPRGFLRHRHPPQGGLHREELGFLQDRYPLCPGGHHPRVYLPVADVRDLTRSRRGRWGKRRSVPAGRRVERIC